MIRRLLLIVTSFVPGTGLILLGREGWGSLLLFVGLNAWNLAFLGFQSLIDPELGWLGWVLGVAASVTSVLWVSVLTSPARCKRLRERADRAYRVAMMALLRSREGDARTAVEAGLQVNRDDPDLRFLSWQLAFSRSGPRLAYPNYRRLRRADTSQKWAWEVRREEELRGRK